MSFHVYQKLPLEGAVVGCTELSEGVLDQVSSSQSELEDRGGGRV